MRMQAGQGFTQGTISSISPDGLTITTRDKGSKIVLTSNTTLVSKMVAGDRADITVGANVSIIGKTGADGSVVAENIQIRNEPVPAAGR